MSPLWQCKNPIVPKVTLYIWVTTLLEICRAHKVWAQEGHAKFGILVLKSKMLFATEVPLGAFPWLGRWRELRQTWTKCFLLSAGFRLEGQERPRRWEGSARGCSINIWPSLSTASVSFHCSIVSLFHCIFSRQSVVCHRVPADLWKEEWSFHGRDFILFLCIESTGVRGKKNTTPMNDLFIVSWF